MCCPGMNNHVQLAPRTLAPALAPNHAAQLAVHDGQVDFSRISLNRRCTSLVCLGT
jgi:hypothetical protein